MRAGIGNNGRRAVLRPCGTNCVGPWGAPPTAALLRRAIAISHESSPTLSIITIEKIGRDYNYNIHPEVKDNPKACDEIGRFVNNVLALLSELTGNVLVRHLLENPIVKKNCSRGEK